MTDQGMTVLIVDDEVIMRRVLREKLSGEGYQCQEAGNADQAMDKLGSSPVELVILDIKMPGKSGIELLPQIKASYPDMAVIMATAVDDAGIAVECMKAGAYDYLTKPFDLEDIVLSVGRALEKRRLELENREYQLTLRRQLESLNKLFQIHLNVRQQTEEVYSHLVGELTRVSNEFQNLVREAQTQCEDLQKPPAERARRSQEEHGTK